MSARHDRAGRAWGRLERDRRAGARLLAACQAAALVAICAAVLVVNGAGVAYTRLFVLPLQWHQGCALNYQETPSSCAQVYTDAGILAFQAWSGLLQTQHNAIFVTGAVGSY
jgi:hypothetical protein